MRCTASLGRRLSSGYTRTSSGESALVHGDVLALPRHPVFATRRAEPTPEVEDAGHGRRTLAASGGRSPGSPSRIRGGGGSRRPGRRHSAGRSRLRRRPRAPRRA